MFTGSVIHYSLIAVRLESRDNHRTLHKCFASRDRSEAFRCDNCVQAAMVVLDSQLAGGQDILNLILH